MKLCLFLLPLLPLVYGHGALVHPPPRNRVIIIMMNKMIDMDGKALYLFIASLHNSLVCILSFRIRWTVICHFGLDLWSSWWKRWLIWMDIDWYLYAYYAYFDIDKVDSELPPWSGPVPSPLPGVDAWFVFSLAFGINKNVHKWNMDIPLCARCPVSNGTALTGSNGQVLPPPFDFKST